MMATEPNMIRKFSCFREMTDEQVQLIAKISNSICYPPDHVLFKEGEEGKILYLLIQGDVDIFYKTDKTDLNRVDTVSSEEIVGCSAMVPPYKYTATVQTLNEVEVLEIETQELRQLIDQDPHLGMKIQAYMIKILMDRILALRNRGFTLAIE
jgi:CRP-like cAMP-binding protein